LEANIKIDLSALNDQQKDAVISEDKRLLVLAGAGSGKTKTLLQKLIYLIEEKGVSPSSILAITFTKNATNEMLDRLSFRQTKVATMKNNFLTNGKVLQKKTEKDIINRKNTLGLTA